MDLKMNVYTPGLELIGLLEVQNSAIWETKAFGAGSFSVSSILTKETRPLLSAENIIWIAGDDAGVIEYISQEAEESTSITVKGCNLTGLLARRILWGRYDLSGTPPQIMHYLVNECAVNPTRGDKVARKIPGLVLLDPPTGGTSIRVQRTGGELLETLEELGATYGVAFGIRFNPAVPQMEFWTRWGVNRSIRQNVNDPVFYSTELDDVLSSQYTYNSGDYRNVALIAGEGDGSDRVMVTVEGEDETYIPDVPTPEPTPDKYTVNLSVDPAGGGVATGGGTVDGGTSITVTAAPAQKYGFVGWRENGAIVSTEPAYTFTVNRNRNLTAVFVSTVVMYTVTVLADPAGGGTVSGGGSVEEGQSVTLTQTTADGYNFTGWYSGGTLLSTANPYTFTPTADITVTAKFAVAPREYTYTGDVVSVMLHPGVYKLEAWGAEGGYRSGTSYAGKGGYSVGTLTLTETTQVFVRAGGAGNTGKTSGGFNGGGRRGTYNGGGGASDIRIGVDDLNHRVIVAGGGGSDGAANKAGGYGGGTAGQSRTDSYGTGGFGGAQTGVSNSSWQTSAQSTSTTTTADAYAGFGFGGNGIAANNGYGGAGGGGWYGGSGSMPDSSGDDDRGGGGGSGWVWTGADAPDGFGLTEAHYLANAQTIDGSKSFASPTGTTETGHSGNGYVRITPIAFYVVTVVSEDSTKGTVSGGGPFEGGAQATVSANPATGYKLSGWYEGETQVSADKDYTFTVSGNRTLMARFVETPVYTITATIDPSGAGTVTGTGQYQEDTQATITATPAEGYTFSGWTENGTTVSTSESYTFTVTENRAFVAGFAERVSRLPDGYTELQYITVGGSVGFDTGIHPEQSNTKIIMDIQIDAFVSGAEHFFSANTSNNRNFYLRRTSPTKAVAGFDGGTVTNISTTFPTNRTTVEYNGTTGKVSIGSTSYSVTRYSYTLSTNLFLFTSYNGGRIVPCQLYSAQVYNGEAIEKDFVPCNNPSGVVGLYDLVGGQFYTNSWSGTVTPGPAV